jgi:hypothetical protein
MWADLDETPARLADAANELELLAVCIFSAIGLVLSFRSVLALGELPEIMALL